MGVDDASYSRVKRIPIWDDAVPYLLQGDEQNIPHLEFSSMPTDSLSPAIIVLPGGGYGRRVEHEGRPVAEWLGSIGISALVLSYRVTPYRYPVPLADAKRAIRYLRTHSASLKIDPNRIGVLGFSAGGHLAGTLGTMFDHGDPASDDPVERMSSQPDLTILCYPVVAMDGEFSHRGSVENLLGSNPDKLLLTALSLENSVRPETGPMFIWHTADDSAVPVENSLALSTALSKARVPFELHVYPEGKHGLGLASEDIHVGSWTAACENWLRIQGF